jgi:uncharacterized small protein (DUF1192 family)
MRFARIFRIQRGEGRLGFEPPNPHDRAGEDDLALLDVMELIRSVDVPEEAVVRLFARLRRRNA